MHRSASECIRFCTHRRIEPRCRDVRADAGLFTRSVWRAFRRRSLGRTVTRRSHLEFQVGRPARRGCARRLCAEAFTRRRRARARRASDYERAPSGVWSIRPEPFRRATVSPCFARLQETFTRGPWWLPSAARSALACGESRVRSSRPARRQVPTPTRAASSVGLNRHP